MAQQGFRSVAGNQFIYQETDTGTSSATGLNNVAQIWKLTVKATAGTTPADAAKISIDPAANGDITFLPNGTGAIILHSVSDDTVSRDLKFDKMRTTGTNIVSGDTIGQIKFRGYAPTSGYVTAASITSTSSGTIANNRVAGDLVFSTHPDSATGLLPTTRMTIASTGCITIAAPDSGTALTITDGGLTISSGSLSLATDLAVTEGGTGASTFTDHGLIIGNAANALTATAEGATGEIIIGTTANPPSWLAAGTDGEVLTANTGAAPSWEPASGGGLAWSAITVDQTAAVDNGYICNKAGLLTVTLPATSAVGKVVRVTGMNTALGWKIAQAANQIIHLGTQTTTTGVGGSLASVNIHDSVELVCCVVDLEFIVVSCQGNITVV